MNTIARRVAGWLVPRLHAARPLRAVGKRLLRGRVVTQPFHSGVICMDAVQHAWAWTGTTRLDQRDAPIQERLIELSRASTTMLDVGSNLGTMALAVALRNPDIRITCVEPNARASALLRQTLALNRLTDRVTVVEAVVGDADGDIGFVEDGSTTGHVAAGGTRKPMIDFARLLAEHAASGRCLVKIDVEGFEAALLAQLGCVRDRRNLIAIVELHAHGFNGLGDPHGSVERLRESGAMITDIGGHPITTVAPWTDRVRTMQIEARWPA